MDEVLPAGAENPSQAETARKWMKVAVIGTGAMGSLFAGCLSEQAQVVMIGSWREQLEAINQSGLRLIHIDGQEMNYSFSAQKDLPAGGSIQLVLVLVKGWQTEHAAEIASHLLTPDGLVLTLQNGLGNYEILAEKVGEQNTASGVTSEGAMIIEPGLVRHTGLGTTHLGSTPPIERRLIEIAGLLNRSGFKTEIASNLEGLLWGKLIVNAGINALTALLQVPNGFLAENAFARDIMCRAAEEAAVVAAALGIELPYRSASERVTEVALATSRNRSSMAQDMARGMPTEIEAINGQVIRAARDSKIPCPVNEALYNLVRLGIETGDWRSGLETIPLDLRIPFEHLANITQDS